MHTRPNPLKSASLILFTLLLLSGCYQELYTDLPQQQINEMMALLVEAGIASKKTAGLEGTWSLRVDADKISAAMNLLQENGLPREAFENMGRVFEKKGLISSPAEERIRFIYALSQEIAATIARIDGVLDARVHIVLPENDPYAETLMPSSAAVFIKQKPDFDLESQTMKIKEMVVNAIEGLEFKNVTVALFKSVSGAGEASPNFYVDILGFKLAPESANRFRWLMVLVVSLGGSGLVAAAIILYRRKRRWSKAGDLLTRIQHKMTAARKPSA